LPGNTSHDRASERADVGAATARGDRGEHRPGALIDEAALVAALKSGQVGAAGLDVFVTEPGGNPDLAALDNVFLLPHIGSATIETRNAMGFRALDNLDAFFAGREPGDRVA
jgi:lactate dehydrogenase-like 2-hydroxyacid dehydrogenase